MTYHSLQTTQENEVMSNCRIALPPTVAVLLVIGEKTGAILLTLKARANTVFNGRISHVLAYAIDGPANSPDALTR